ncbi:hypothetical protein RHMOL_Rhmol08G0189100 [Rhododendron molle]|uniref:Uncharacterized protein n=1 Tax=Rhododendron molle TaxID=49168 RepID=A0ACC0MQ78_RHOML|nr:hypothetical protein RHMOL_Rhmol08G0189100 [Rhododendron molle]
MLMQGILSTEKGQRALLSFDSLERSLIEVHSKGVNMELVENLLLDQERKFSAEAISLEKSTLWKTHEKNFETWICPLVYALIGYSDDIILRLCQDIVMLKAEVAELLLPNVVVNLAGRKNLDIDLCRIISLQVNSIHFKPPKTPPSPPRAAKHRHTSLGAKSNAKGYWRGGGVPPSA